MVYTKEIDNRPPIVLYNVNKNTHWIPGTKSIRPSTKTPIKYSYTMNTITIHDLIQKINNYKNNKATIHDKTKNISNINSITDKKIIQDKEGILINLSPQLESIPSKQENVNQVINENDNINKHKNSISNAITYGLMHNKINALNNNIKTGNKEINNIHINNIPINKEIIYDKEGTLINISTNLNLVEHKQVIELVKEYLHLFTTDTSKVRPANIEPCEIKMKPNYKDPKFNAPHRVSPQQRNELKSQLDKLLEAKIIRPIISKFAAPAFLVKKKEKGSYRLVVSYKELNERVETDQYPIPRTTDLLRALEGSQYFTSLDLNSGFFQLPIKFEDQYKLAFTSIHGLMTFTRLPQGFKNSSAIFQRILNESFSPLLYKSLIIYIDDLASYGKNFKQSLENLKNAFIIMDKMNFSLKTNKCLFFNDKIELLGHNISINGITPLNRNIKAITEFKQPETQKDIRSFIGMCSYYRKHIKDFAKISHPLTELIKGDIKLMKWEKEQKQSFSLLKELLTSEPLLKHFDDDKEVFLTIDASITGLGACLEQPNNKNILHPIGYASRKLLNNEKTYSSTTLELLGLVFGITYFREYLWGRQFIVFCDNISLQYYKTLKIPSARIARLTLKLLDFTFKILYKKGKENKVADALSRNAINLIINDNETESDNLDKYDIKTLQSKDQFCTDIIKAINDKDDKDNNINKNIKRKSRQFVTINDILFHKHFTPPNKITNLLVVPKILTNEVLKSYHESPIGGHTGISRTIHKLQNKYYWTTLSKDTTQFIKTCHKCQINKKLPGKPIGQLQPIPITNKPMDRLVFDYLGPLISSNKKKYVLVAACSNTKYIFTKAVHSATAESTVKFLIKIVSHWGSFKQFSSDRGTHFKNKLVEEVTKNLGIKQILSTAYSPETQGFVERVNGVLCYSLKNYINDDNQHRWSYFLPYITLAYNATPQTSTNYSPFFLMHGFEPYFPIDNKIIPEEMPYNIFKSLKELNDIRNKIPQIVKKAQQKQKKYHDKSHRIINFNPGDKVLVKFPFLQVGKSPKLAQKYRGPFKIIKKITELNYKVELTLNNKTTEDIIHVRRIKPYYHR
uniref:RNA-directed DNA polymerase n=1 Tax=Sipha flava TaxID=143950 RepID=A0A2S2QEP6_9HEMI